MAAAFRDADRVNLPDYSESHRTPPPIPASPTTTTTPPTSFTSARARAQSHSATSGQQSSTRPTSRRGGDAAGADQGHSRRGSLPFLRRTFSNASARSQSKNDVESVPPVPQLPNTRISHAHAEAAARRVNNTTIEGAPQSGEKTSDKMLRKVSKSRAEKERAIREATQAAAAPRQPPSLPLPTFTEENHPDTRDSVAIFNTAYTHSASTTAQSQPRPTANFSRPAMAPASNTNSSSSPAYAARSADAAANSSSPAVAPRGNGEYVVDDRTQSMTHRGRYSYASSVGQVNAVNSPRRVRRRKDPTPFNVLVIGAKNSGKTSFISFLRHSLALPANKHSSGHLPESQVGGSSSSFKSDYLETEIDGERVGLTLWDSAGLEKNIVDLQLREMTAFVEAKFEDTFVEEQKVMRSPGVKDTHIHCVILILDPVRLDSTIAASATFHKHGTLSGNLDEHLDVQVIRALWGKTTVIPIISKADTVTVSHMRFLKRAVWGSLRGAGLNPLEALELEEEDEDDEDEEEDGSDDAETPAIKTKRNHKRQSSMSAAALTADDEAPYLPMSILSPDFHDLPPYVPASKAGVTDKVGRKFPWGFADPYDPDHCDFGRFRDSIFSEWRSELRELSRTKWYENWRTSRLQNLPGSRQRIKGGVTPVAAVPKEGRSVSGARQFSSASVVGTTPSNSSLAAGSTVPRSVSNMTNSTAINGDRARDFSGSSQAGSVVGGTYRSVDSYK